MIIIANQRQILIIPTKTNQLNKFLYLVFNIINATATITTALAAVCQVENTPKIKAAANKRITIMDLDEAAILALYHNQSLVQASF